MQHLEAITADPILAPVRFSNLRHMSRSPLHYRSNILLPRAQSALMRFGKLCHCLVLGGEVVVWDHDRRGKDWKQFEAENDGAFIVTRAEHDRAYDVAEAVKNHHRAAELLDGDRELTIPWAIGDRACLSHLDVLGRDVVELKVCSTTQPDRLRRACLGMSYHGQLGFYSDAAAFIGREPRGHYIVGVEPQPPYAVTVLRVTPRAIDAGKRLCRLWLEQLRTCEDSDSWPGYVQTDVDLDIDDDTNITIDGEEVQW